MKMNESKEGELVFLPSDITLIKFKGEGPVGKWKRTDKPCVGLVVDGCDNVYTEVLYNGECWMARKQDLYPVEK
tara:strand:- start:119 stop:340 length:222 start_codon:yes stop_codon:yes gene_type:complete